MEREAGDPYGGRETRRRPSRTRVPVEVTVMTGRRTLLGTSVTRDRVYRAFARAAPREPKPPHIITCAHSHDCTHDAALFTRSAHSYASEREILMADCFDSSIHSCTVDCRLSGGFLVAALMHGN